MRNDLQSPLDHLIAARTLLRRHPSRLLYPHLYEDLDHDIESLRIIIAAIDDPQPAAADKTAVSKKREQLPPGAARP